MSNTELSHQVLKEAADAFKSARRSVYEGAALLHRIKEESLYEGQFSSFNEYCETECQLSRGYVSKLLTAYEYYVIDQKVSPRNFYDIDYEKLYFSTKLPTGTPEQRLVKAREWSRDDFRAELSSKEGVDCAHPEDKHIVLCGVCSKRVG